MSEVKLDPHRLSASHSDCLKTQLTTVDVLHGKYFMAVAACVMQCRVIYVATAVEVDWWADRFLRDPRLDTVALDIEWRVTFKTGGATKHRNGVWSQQSAYAGSRWRRLHEARSSTCTLLVCIIRVHDGANKIGTQGRRLGQQPWCSWHTSAPIRRRVSRSTHACCCMWRSPARHRRCVHCCNRRDLRR